MIQIQIVAAMEMAAVLNSRRMGMMLPEGSVVRDLLTELQQKYGEPMTKILYGSGRDLQQVLLLNGRSILYHQGFETELKDGDQVFLMPLVAGG